ncbi:PspA/IM30 family protein [bacterium]|nr:PspA/IM30 family protein [bacterium]
MPNLWQSIKNTIRGKGDELANKMADPVRDGKIAIEDSKKQIAKFTDKIAKLSAHNKKQHKTLEGYEADVQKYLGLAERAAKAGDRDDARQALELKSKAQERFDSLKKEVEQNEAILANLREGLTNARARVANAQSNMVSLEARREGAKVRTELAKASTEFSAGQSPLAALDDLEKAVNDDEASAEAWEEMAEVKDPGKSLEDKYGSAKSSVDDELEKLMGGN